MTSMIDIVFLLLIFFMTVSQISQVNQQPIELPKLAGTEDQDPTVMTINIMEDGSMMVGDEPATLSGVVAAVSAALSEVNDDTSRLTVVLRADARGTSRMVNEVVRSLSQMQVTRVRLAVEAPQG